MDTITNIDTLAHQIRTIDLLRKISRKIGGLDCAACNGDLTKRQQTRLKNLLAQADELAQSIGYQAYHQSDPRGVSLYLVDETMDDSNYNRGIALY